MKDFYVTNIRIREKLDTSFSIHWYVFTYSGNMFDRFTTSSYKCVPSTLKSKYSLR